MQNADDSRNKNQRPVATEPSLMNHEADMTRQGATLPGLLAVIAVILLCFAAPANAADPYFEVEDLNAGLGDAPADLDRSTPQSTVEALLDTAIAKDFAAAAHLLDLSRIPAAEQPERGEALATKLHAVVERKVVIDWAALLERPDSLDARATADSAVAGQVRRSLLLWILDMGDREVAIRLDRIKPADGDPVWVFAATSVANIDRLYELHGPTTLEQRLPEVLRTHAFWNLMWWEVIGLPVVAALAIIAGLLVRRLMTRLDAATSGGFAHTLVRAVRRPLIILAATVVISALTGTFFVFSGHIGALLGPLVTLGFVIVALMLTVNTIDAVLDRLMDFTDSALDDLEDSEHRSLITRVAAGRRALIILIVLIGGGVILSQAQLFNTLGFSLLASAGAITLVLAFAARTVLSNIMSSMQIALNQSARIGDRILFRGHLCDVERINFTYVQLRDWTGVRLVVPVNEFMAEPFENWTMKEESLTRLIRIQLSTKVDVGYFRKLFHDLVDDLEEGEIGDRDAMGVYVTDQDIFGQTVTFCLPCASPRTAWAMSCEMREKLIKHGRQLERDGETVFPEPALTEAPG